MSLEVVVGKNGLSASDLISIARHQAQVTISQEALDAMATSRKIVDDLAASEIPAYGISTGFGALAKNISIPIYVHNYKNLSFVPMLLDQERPLKMKLCEQ